MSDTPLPSEATPRSPMTHELKVWPEPFAALEDGRKTFEWRRDDRDYQVGDTIWLREFDPATACYTHRRLERRITYVLRGRFEVPEGFAVLGLAARSLPAPPAPGGRPDTETRFALDVCDQMLDIASRQGVLDTEPVIADTLSLGQLRIILDLAEAAFKARYPTASAGKPDADTELFALRDAVARRLHYALRGECPAYPGQPSACNPAVCDCSPEFEEMSVEELLEEVVKRLPAPVRDWEPETELVERVAQAIADMEPSSQHPLRAMRGDIADSYRAVARVALGVVGAPVVRDWERDPKVYELLRDLRTTFGLHTLQANDKLRALCSAVAALPAGPSEQPTEMRMCEINALVLHEDQLYRFTKDPGCAKCEAYSGAAVAGLPVSGGPE